MMISQIQFEKLQQFFYELPAKSEFYKMKYEQYGFDPRDIQTMDDFLKIPFLSKEDLRDAYPLKIQAVEDEQIVRIHSSSGTTGLPVIIPYTQEDVDTWAEMMSRCYRTAGITNLDRIQITPGYGLWTAGIGFQLGCERLGAMAIPMGPGNTEKQLQMMNDLGATVITATSSYCLLLAEEIAKRGMRESVKLKKGVIGSERWGEKMKERIIQELGIDLYDIYGLTEIYGPGISISCDADCGLHYWDDYLYFEVIDPQSGQPVPDGEYGELVITTLTKQGAPLIRYRTRDITRLLSGECSCGSPYPRHDRIIGRVDDMTKVKGVNIYPAQIDDLLKATDGASSEYQIVITRDDGKDTFLLRAECENGVEKENLQKRLHDNFKKRIGILIDVEVLSLGELPRSEKKTKRVYDYRTR
ncbi:MAG: phenylacetate--CoA ligase family protein [Anaerofustis sp.]